MMISLENEASNLLNNQTTLSQLKFNNKQISCLNKKYKFNNNNKIISI